MIDVIEAARSVGVYRSELVATLNAAGMAIALPTLETALKRVRSRLRKNARTVDLAPVSVVTEAAAAPNVHGTADNKGHAAPSLEQIQKDSPHLTTTEARRARAETFFQDAKPGPSFIERFTPRR
ncbi:hypothetical protein [Paraburkholderia flagellata]|uniref:hypothetical protein n=1 Tax=Paraburkholderia flagellata TaxID=2883241 RepID=UPI001F455B49|nr:hypothetical protein [Paraburkholderia flagellata]